MGERVALFIGRWQPFHNGHKWIVDQALDNGKKVCIGVRDTDVNERDPYTYEQRERMIKHIYGDRVDVMRFPDIESINIGRKVGYDVNRVDAPEPITNISATKVRGGDIEMVPKGTQEYVKLMQTTIWFTGLPCSGKTTLAEAFKPKLEAAKCHIFHLDGDVVRDGLCGDLTFSDNDRKENLRRIAHVADMFNTRKTTVLASFVSPSNEMRDQIRAIIPNFKLIHVKCTPEECAKRDVKGMWAKAKAGEIKGFTGFDAPFDDPMDADLVLDTAAMSMEECLKQLIDYFIPTLP